MTNDELQLLREFRAEIPAPDAETRRRIYAHATSDSRAKFGGRRRRLPSFAAAAAIAAAVVALLLVSPWSGDGGLVQRALAAVGTGEVLHVVTEQPEPGPIPWYQPVSLPSGTPIPVTIRQEIWLDRSRDLEKTVTTLNGAPDGQLLQTSAGDFGPDGNTYHYCTWDAAQKKFSCADETNGQTGGPPPNLEPALTGFIDDYQSALASGQATKTSTGEVDGKQVIWLRIAADPKDYLPAEEVAIDASTYAPLLVRTLDVNPVQFTVTEIGTQAYDPSLFTRPTVEYPPMSSTTEPTTPLDATQAPSVLGGQALWLGQTWNGYQLVQVEKQPFVDNYAPASGKQPVPSVGVVFTYAPPGGSADGPDVLRIEESQQCEMAWQMFCGDAPSPTQGVLVLGQSPIPSTTMLDGVYVAISQNSSQSDPVAVANALQPLTGSGS